MGGAKVKKPSSKKTRRERQRRLERQWTLAQQQRPTCAICRPLLTLAAASMTVLLAVLLTSCTTTGRALKTETACAAFRPILISKESVLADADARDILAHNLTGAKLCGWKAKMK
jgi:hypothetical protein